MKRLSILLRPASTKVATVATGSVKNPPHGKYLGPKNWNLRFPRHCGYNHCYAEVQQDQEKADLGPSEECDKKGEYKNPEYYSFHNMTYYDVEHELKHHRKCIDQPDPYADTKPPKKKC